MLFLVQGGPVEILPFLYLGSAYHAARRDMLDALGITALLNVSSDCPNHFEGHYQYKCIPVEDNHKADIGSWFMEAIEYIGRWAQTGSQTGSQNPVGEHERKPLGTWVLWAGLSRLGIRVCSFPLLPTLGVVWGGDEKVNSFAHSWNLFAWLQVYRWLRLFFHGKEDKENVNENP